MLWVVQWGALGSRLDAGIAQLKRVRGIERQRKLAAQSADQARKLDRQAKSASQVSKPVGDTQLVVDLSDRIVHFHKGTQVLNSYELAVAQEGWETPTGSFQIADMERDPIWVHPITGVAVPAGPDNPLGVAWIGFWSDGKTEIGFHGTNQEELIGQAVSHGCLRMRNQDIEALYAQVTEGTLVIVRQ